MVKSDAWYSRPPRFISDNLSQWYLTNFQSISLKIELYFWIVLFLYKKERWTVEMGLLCVNGAWTRAIWCYDLVVNGGSVLYVHYNVETWNGRRHLKSNSIDSMTMGFKESSFHTCWNTAIVLSMALTPLPKSEW